MDLLFTLLRELAHVKLEERLRGTVEKKIEIQDTATLFANTRELIICREPFSRWLLRAVYQYGCKF